MSGGINRWGLGVSLLLVTLIMGCGDEAIHASVLVTPNEGEGTPVELPDLSYEILEGPLILDEAKLVADTILILVVEKQMGDSLNILVAHKDGELEADGTSIPPLTYLLVDCFILDEGRRVYGIAEKGGHALEIDVDVDFWGSDPEKYDMAGYATVDNEKPVWIEALWNREFVAGAVEE